MLLALQVQAGKNIERERKRSQQIQGFEKVQIPG